MSGNIDRSKTIVSHSLKSLQKTTTMTTSPKTTSPTQKQVEKNSKEKDLPVTSEKAESKTIVKPKKVIENQIPRGTTTEQQPVGIHINSPNSNVRIQGSKIEVKEKPAIKREINMSAVILKVPDPAKFLGNKEVKKRARPAKATFKPVTTDVSVKPVGVTKGSTSKCEHQQKEPHVAPPVTNERIKTRPERSAKKRAKDSISEMSEAEHLSSVKDSRRHHSGGGSAPHSPRHQWPELRSPSQMVNSLEYHRYDYYPDRSPHSPNVHRHESRSPLVHLYMSPEGHMQSPPHHSIHGRPLSPVRHRHSHSPPRHLHNHRDQDEHVKHLYTEPLSPRYHSNRDHFCYSERSRSPYYFEYRHEKDRNYPDDMDGPSPSYKMRRSPRDIISPHSHKAEKFPFVHLTEPCSPVNHRKHHDVKSPVTVQEGRFPYGHMGWEGQIYRGELSSPPLDSTYQYQPLSRLTLDLKSPVISKKKTERNFSPETLAKTAKCEAKHVTSPKLGEAAPSVGGCPLEKRIKIFVDTVLHSPSKDQPLAFYPTDKPMQIGKDKLKPKVPVIEIPEQTMRTPSERRTPTSKRKGCGSFLEMKIQGLTKKRMEQLGDSSKTNSNEIIGPLKSPSAKASKSISAVLDTLSNAGKVTSSESSSLIDALSRTNNTLISEPTKVIPLSKSVSQQKRTLRDVKSLNLDAIAKNLTKSVEQQSFNTGPLPSKISAAQKSVAVKSPPLVNTETSNVKHLIPVSKKANVVTAVSDDSVLANIKTATNPIQKSELKSRLSVVSSVRKDLSKKTNNGIKTKTTEKKFTIVPVGAKVKCQNTVLNSVGHTSPTKEQTLKPIKTTEDLLPNSETNEDLAQVATKDKAVVEISGVLVHQTSVDVNKRSVVVKSDSIVSEAKPVEKLTFSSVTQEEDISLKLPHASSFARSTELNVALTKTITNVSGTTSS